MSFHPVYIFWKCTFYAKWKGNDLPFQDCLVLKFFISLSCLSVWIKFQKIFTTKWVSIENSVFETDFILYISAKKRRPFSHTYEMVEQLLLLLFFSNSTTLKLPSSQQLWSRVENQLVQMFFERDFTLNFHVTLFSRDVFSLYIYRGTLRRMLINRR